MKRLEVNPNNEKYYTKDFISGFRCGTKRQLESDLTVLDKIRAEIMELDTDYSFEGFYRCQSEVLAIIDKCRK